MFDLRAHGKTYNKYEFINKLLKQKGFLEYFPKARGLISDYFYYYKRFYMKTSFVENLR